MVSRQRRVPGEVERPREKPEIMTKPLPAILDEMEANIRAAAEAAKRAEEARQAGETAAETATKAASEAANMHNVGKETRWHPCLSFGHQTHQRGIR